jgi:hypothetical protein
MSGENLHFKARRATVVLLLVSLLMTGMMVSVVQSIGRDSGTVWSGPPSGIRSNPSAGAHGYVSDLFPAAPTPRIAGPAGTSGIYWSNITVLGAGAPAGTLGGSMAFDPGINATVFLGASGFDYAEFAASFVYADYHWSALNKTVPDEYAALAYDNSSSDLIAFGGEAPIPSEIGNTIPTDATYALVGTVWTNVTANLTNLPPAAGDPMMAEDPAAGGALLLDPLSSVNTSETWMYSDGAWVNLTATAGPPPPGPGGSDGVLTYDPTLHAVLFFGGSLPGPGYANATNETWEFANGTWTNLHLVGPDFATGAVQTMAFEAPTGEMVDLLAPAAYYSENGTPSYQQWDFNGSGWANATAAAPALPPLGYDPLSVWDAEDGYLLYMSGGYDAQTWALGQIALNATITVAPSPVDVGNATTIQVVATGGVPPLRYSYSDLPPGCPAPPEPTFTCAPTTAGNYTVRATVTDGANTTINVSAVLEVAAVFAVHGPLVVAPEAYLGSNVTFSVSTSGGVPPYDYEWSVPAAPCTPPDSDEFACPVEALGPSAVSVTVRDATPFGVASVTEGLTIVDRPTLSSFVASSSQVEVGQPLSFNTSVQGGALPLVYSYTDLPTGCVASDDPVVSCITSASGVFNTTVTVEDGLGTAQTAATSVTVVPSVRIVSENVAPNPSPLGSIVTFSYTVAGGAAPFHVDWTDLPAGCDAAASAFSCAMNASGSFDIELTVRDVLGGVAAANVTLVVHASGPVPNGSSSSGPLPLWVWALVGLGVVLVVAAVILRRRGSGGRGNDPSPPPAPEEPDPEGEPSSQST